MTTEEFQMGEGMSGHFEEFDPGISLTQRFTLVIMLFGFYWT
jgi:hypothetical protein